ncbi:MAG TPA: glycerophosphodiester phosphodiesterase [Thermoanaerobaculia bacterium]|nr:glycerophosphodiester phosphodiesterase [Thermoanaerobaculia bacterium]
MPGDLHHFLIFGHRGSPRRFRENTMESFEGALAEGADGFETDLRLLSDGVAVLFHDDEVDGRPVETFTSRDIAAQRVRDLSRFAGQATMILEVKRGKWVDALMREIGSWQKIVVASFDHSLIAELARRKVHFPLGLTVSGVIVDLPDYAQRLGARWCFPDHHYVDAELVAALHAAAIDVVPWTPNRADDWKRLREIGCDGMITDYPGEAVRWRAGSA